MSDRRSGMARYDFSGRVALVTGAAGGIGRATAIELARAGAKVAVADIDLDPARQTVALIENAVGSGSGAAIAIQVDVASSASVAKMVATTVERFGRLDFAHNNAGIMGGSRPLVEMPDEVFERGIGVMLTGVFYCMKHEIPAMIRGGGGAIVNTSSGAGLIGVPNQADYVAAKHGVIGLTRTAALENVGKNVRINAICPGTARSRMVDGWLQGSEEAERQIAALHPIGRIAEPEEIARAVCWLLSDDASFVIGSAMTADGGYTVP